MRAFTTRQYLLALVSAVLVPLLAFVAFLLFRYEVTERARIEREAIQIARQITLIVDAELKGIVSSLRGLSVSSSLANGDLASFYLEARRLVHDRDEVIVLRDLGTTQLINTQVPFGQPLPAAIQLSAADRAVLESGQALVGDVYRSPVSGEIRIPVGLPVRASGSVRVLALTLPTSRIRDVVLPAVPPGWIVGVGDKAGTYVARSARHEDVTGKPGVREYLAKAVGRLGSFTSVNFEGRELLAGYYRSEFSDWLFAANISTATVEAPLWRSLGLLALLGSVALLLSALAAWIFGARFLSATSGLADRAIALGEGRPVPPTKTRLVEFAIVGDALVGAAAAVEKRTNELRTVLSTVPAAVLFTYDPEVRRVVRNRFAADLLGVSEGETPSVGGNGSALAHVRLTRQGRSIQDQERPLYRAIRGEQVKDEEYTYIFVDGHSRTMLTNAVALRSDDDVIVGAVSVSLDITERKRGEEQRELLVHELNHRVKNTLATVQSVAQQTLRNARDPAEAAKALSDRLVAIAKAHDVLTRENWTGAELEDIVAGITAAYEREKFDVSGPPIRLPPALSLSFSLALHELATNAAKYGALSTANGKVLISWGVRAEPDTQLELNWIEQGGPPVHPPTHVGFGTRLIQRTLSSEIGGSATIDYAPRGLVCTVIARL